MATIITLITGLFGGFGGVYLWEGYIKPRRLEVAIKKMLSAEVAMNLERLTNFRAYHKADPYASLTTLGAYNTVFLAVVTDLWVLKPELVRRVLDFYRKLAHIQHGIELADLIRAEARQAEGAAEHKKANQLLQNRKQVLADMDSAVQPLVVEGEVLLSELSREAFSQYRVGNSRRQLRVGELERRLRSRREGGDIPLD